MPRLVVILAFALIALAACGGDEVRSELNDELPLGAGEPASATNPPAVTVGPRSDAPVNEAIWDLDGLEIQLEQPELWRAVTTPPEGADAAVYAPSDNNFVAERLLVKAVPLDSTASSNEHVERASNDLNGFYDEVVVLEATPTRVGVDQFPAQQIRFTWQRPQEAGVGWRWVVAADSQLIFITYLADLSEPNLYLREVQDVLESAVIGG